MPKSSLTPERYQHAQTLLRDRLELKLLTDENVKVGIAMNEKIAVITFADLTGKIDFDSGFTSSSVDFHRWCNDLFRGLEVCFPETQVAGIIACRLIRFIKFKLWWGGKCLDLLLMSRSRSSPPQLQTHFISARLHGLFNITDLKHCLHCFLWPSPLRW